MKKPTKCDFCGSGLKPVKASEDLWVFDCDSYLDPCDDERIIQSEKCKTLVQLKQKPETPRTAMHNLARDLDDQLNEANQFKTDAYAQIERLNQQLEETEDVRDSWCEEFTKTRNELYATQQLLSEARGVVQEIGSWFLDLTLAILTTDIVPEVIKLKAYACHRRLVKSYRERFEIKSTWELQNGCTDHAIEDQTCPSKDPTLCKTKAETELETTQQRLREMTDVAREFMTFDGGSREMVDLISRFEKLEESK